ncbi:hypothetical protein EZV62_025355 [Acer yangbiense]|uniref:S-acyltransferase n=1 Tax=Acer yangbiense TaxID=1000413 RepID=A0A5C7GXM6_9ROSI|nr:hypothetical protein EZV62_025355 [Acer yangbiense]
MNWQRFISIPVFAVLIVASVVYYITVLVFIRDWVGFQTSTGFWNALIFTLLLCLCFFSFFVSVLTDPGHVPASYVPDVEDSLGSDQELKKPAAEVRQCDKCSTYKPPRSHHCKVCRRCVLRMVIIISSALQKNWDFSGRAQLKLLYVSWKFIIHSFNIEFNLDVLLETLSIMKFSVCSGVVMVALSLTLGTLLGWHIYLITRNMTTIEYYEGIRAAWLARKSGQSYQHPFNLSVYKNITLILGPNVLKWFCPTAVGHLKDGIGFPTSRYSS